MSIDECRVLKIPTIQDPSGSLSIIEGNRQIPFTIQRTYYIYGVALQAVRGMHAHRDLKQLLIPLSGSFDVTLDDGTCQKTFTLDTPNKCLYICPMVWRVMKNFSPGSVCLVLASEYYDEADYIRNYDDFQKAVQTQAVAV